MKTTISNNLHIIQFAFIIIFIAFGVYTNAKEVPQMKSIIYENTTRISVLESKLQYIKESLDRIERHLRR